MLHSSDYCEDLDSVGADHGMKYYLEGGKKDYRVLLSKVRVSIIASAYNEEKYISEMMDSIIAQSYQNWELIIIDDASTDRTWEIIGSYKDGRIKASRNSSNIGLTANLNKALNMAQGEYIARIDADDIAFHDRIRKQVKYMDLHPEVVLCGGWMREIGNRYDICRTNVNSDVLKIKLLFNAVIAHPTFIIRKAALEKNQLSYDENLLYAQDYRLEYQMSKIGKISNMPEILVGYRIHNTQISKKSGLKQKEYADETRTLILKDMRICLTEEQNDLWIKFCMLDCKDICDEDIMVLKDIIEIIIRKNDIELIFDHEHLKRILNGRFKRFVDLCEFHKNVNSDSIHGSSYDYKFQKMAMSMYFLQRIEKYEIRKCFIKNGIKSVAIYGMGYLGEYLYSFLKEAKIQVGYGIDSFPEGCVLYGQIPIFLPSEKLDKVDIVIITVVEGYRNIKQTMKRKGISNVMDMEKLIEMVDF